MASMERISCWTTSTSLNKPYAMTVAVISGVGERQDEEAYTADCKESL
jgi:hypothetical protein